MTSYKKYPKYKDSNIAWLGEIPEHWEVKRLKNIIRAKITDGPHETPTFIDEGIPFLSVDSIQNGELTFKKTRFISYENYIQYNKKANVQKDDILLGKAASIGKVARVKVDFKFSIWSPLALIKPKLSAVIPSYFEYLLKSPLTQYQIQQLSTSNTQQNISMDDIPKFIFSIPNIQEQQAIANYLDKATAKIDTLIQKQEKLIELLKEKRQALISHAVTKGLNPDAKMKDSGIEWLGEIPEHWILCKLKYYGIYKSGDFISADKISKKGIYPVLGGNGLRGYSDTFNLKGHYVIIGRQGALCGNINYSQGKFWATEHAIVVHNKKNINVKWLGALLDTMNLNQYSVSAAQPGLAVENITNLKAILPPLSEQKEIAQYLDDKTSKIDNLITKATKAIDLLKEKRTALISATVTGKIDVREQIL